MFVLDPALFFLLAIVVPVAGYVSFKRLVRRIEAGEAFDRNEFYQTTMVSQWILFALTLAAWLYQGRSLGMLGFERSVQVGFYLGVGLTLAGIIALLIQIRQIKSASTEEIQRIRKQVGNLEFIFPRNGNELGRFYTLSLTAGIVEETLWRGFIIWYLAQFMPLWAAASVSVIGFTVAHAYQGTANLPKIAVIGAFFTGLFFLSGSLFLPIILHAAVDILQGRAAYEVMRRADDADSSDTDRGVVGIT